MSLYRQSFRAFSKKGESAAGMDQLSHEEKDKLKKKVEKVVGGNISDMGKRTGQMKESSPQFSVNTMGEVQEMAEREWKKENQSKTSESRGQTKESETGGQTKGPESKNEKKIIENPERQGAS